MYKIKQIFLAFFLFLFIINSLNIFIYKTHAIELSNIETVLETKYIPPKTEIVQPTYNYPSPIITEEVINYGSNYNPYSYTIEEVINENGDIEEKIFISFGVKKIRLNPLLFNNNASSLIDKITFIGPFGDETILRDELINRIKGNMEYFESRDLSIGEILNTNLFLNQDNKCYYLNKFYKESRPIFIGFDKDKLQETKSIYVQNIFTEEETDDVMFYSNVDFSILGNSITTEEKFTLYKSIYNNFILKKGNDEFSSNDTRYLNILNKYGINANNRERIIIEVILDGLINEHIKIQLSFNENFKNDTNNNIRTNPSPGMVDIETYTPSFWNEDFRIGLETYENTVNRLNFLSGAEDFVCNDTELKTKIIYIGDNGKTNFVDMDIKILGDGNIPGLNFLRGKNTTFEYYNDYYKSSKGYTKAFICGVYELTDEDITCKLIDTTITDDPNTIESEQILNTWIIPMMNYSNYEGKDMFDTNGYLNIGNKRYKVDLDNNSFNYIGTIESKTIFFAFIKGVKDSISNLIPRLPINSKLGTNISSKDDTFFSCQNNECFMFKDEMNIYTNSEKLTSIYNNPSSIPMEYNNSNALFVIGKPIEE